MEKQPAFSSHQLQRIDKFLRFDNPPSPHHPIDTILVLGTSRILDKSAFDLRISAALFYAQNYKNAYIVFSGKRPDRMRASSEELESHFIEAAVMANEAIRRGLDKKRIALEVESTNTRENLINSLNLLPNSKNLLIICSSYVGRRVNLYLNRMQQESLIPRKNYFIVDADVRLDKSDRILNRIKEERKQFRLVYEWERLKKYRRKGHL